MKLSVIEHIATRAKAYVAALSALAGLLLQQTLPSLPTWEHTALVVVWAIGTFAVTFVTPNRTTGVTIGQAVAMDGTALAQATAALKDVTLPGYVTPIENAAETVATQAEAAGPLIDAVVPQSPVSEPLTAPQVAAQENVPPVQYDANGQAITPTS